MPRVEPVGDDVARLARAHDPCHRYSRARAGRCGSTGTPPSESRPRRCQAAPTPVRRRRMPDRCLPSPLATAVPGAVRATGRPMRRTSPFPWTNRHPGVDTRPGPTIQRRHRVPPQPTQIQRPARRTGRLSDIAARREAHTNFRSACAAIAAVQNSMTAGSASRYVGRCADHDGPWKYPETRLSFDKRCPQIGEQCSSRVAAFSGPACAVVAERPRVGTVCRSCPVTPNRFSRRSAADQPVVAARSISATGKSMRMPSPASVEALVRSGHAGAAGEVAGRKSRTVVAVQHLLAHNTARSLVSAYSACRRACSPLRTLVLCFFL